MPGFTKKVFLEVKAKISMIQYYEKGLTLVSASVMLIDVRLEFVFPIGLFI